MRLFLFLFFVSSTTYSVAQTATSDLIDLSTLGIEERINFLIDHPDLNIVVDKYGQDTQLQLTLLQDWAENEGSESQIAICRFLKCMLLLPSDSTELYDKVVVANDLWQSLDHLPTRLKLIALNRLEVLYERVGRNQEQLQVALKICEIERTEKGGEGPCVGLGGTYHKLRNYNMALYYYRKNRAHVMNEGNRITAAGLTNNIASVYAEIGEPDSAKLAFQKALDIMADSTGMTAQFTSGYASYFIKIIQWNLLSVDEKRGLAMEKLALVPTILEGADRHGEGYWQFRAYHYMAWYYYQRGDHVRAINYCDSAKMVAEVSNNIELLPQIHQVYGKTYLTVGEKEKANYHFYRAETIIDSLKTVQSHTEATVAAAFYEAKEKEAQLSDSKEQTQLSLILVEEQAKQKRWAFLFSVISLVLLILMFRLYRTNAKDKKLILVQKERLEKVLQEKETLLKEIHHRVKNNLQVISSLLELQSNRLSDEVSQNAFQEGQNRVKSIALIHQQLYQGDDLSAVEFTDFTKLLFKQIRAVMVKKGIQVELKLNTDKTTFDIDTAVPLGLILNEMFTNSFKYVFNKNLSGQVIIELKNLGKGRYRLCYSDGGPGLPPDIDIKKVRTLGLRLIYRLTKQLGGSVATNTEDGNLFIIKFLDAEARKEIN
ncbi:MAG: hypothetical protein JKX84_07955 [Flavobacteriales bacterium]|nr:hypothetical protein [Flavobacteriales bacterium]